MHWLERFNIEFQTIMCFIQAVLLALALNNITNELTAQKCGWLVFQFGCFYVSVKFYTESRKRLK